VECVVRDGDFSQKTVYHCELCDRWFCEKHIEPKLSFMRNLSSNHPREVEELYNREYKREDGHPDFEYSRRKFAELDIEEKTRSELIKDALDRMNGYYKRRPIQTLTLKTPKEEPKTQNLPDETPRTKPRRSIPVKKIVGALMALIVLGVFLWYSPSIISMLQKPTVHNTSAQNTSNQGSSYTKLTLIINSSPYPNFTTLTIGDIDYLFSYIWQNPYRILSVGDSTLEGTSYANPTNGSVYMNFGLQINVSEADSNQIVLLVKPTVQDYLASLSFVKMTISQGQYQTVNFSGNQFTIQYLQNPPYYVNELIVSTSLLQTDQYAIFSSEIINCSLGLNIRVYKATAAYTIIYVKPSY
jgi:hypothetical protein